MELSSFNSAFIRDLAELDKTISTERENQKPLLSDG